MRLSLTSFLIASTLTTSASAYCRTTTCDLSSDGCQRNAEGCSVEGSPVFWEDPCLSFAVQIDGSMRAGLDADEVASLARQAAALWQNVECPDGGNPGFSLNFKGFSSCPRPQTVCGGAEANDSVISFRDDAWPAEYPERAAGLTSLIGELDTGAIVDADIEINSFEFSFQEGNSDAIDLSVVLAHELGHYLGLDHSSNPAALMGPAYTEWSAPALHDDDIDGICAIFPPRESELSCPAQSINHDACAEEDLSTTTSCPVPPEETAVPSENEAEASGCSYRASHAGPAERWPALLMLLALVCLTRRSSKI